MKDSEKVKVVAKILKRRFLNLETSEAIHIAYLIIEALDKPVDKVEIHATTTE